MRDDTKNGCVADCHCLGDMAARMCEVLARPWVGVCVPHASVCLWIAFSKRSV